MALNKDNIQILTLDKANILVEDIKKYNKLTDAILQGNINVNSDKIKDEIERAKREESRIETSLDSKINEETTRAKGIESQLQSDLDSEIALRENAIQSLTNQHNTDKEWLILDSHGYTDSELSKSKDLIYSHIDTKVQNLGDELKNSIASTNNKIDNNVNSQNSLQSSLNSHVGNTQNPHNVTTAQIGALNQTDFENFKINQFNPVHDDLEIAKTDIVSIEQRTSNNETNIDTTLNHIEALQGNIADLQNNKLNTVGSGQTLTGSLKISSSETNPNLTGDLTVDNNLTVNNDLNVKGNLNITGVTTTTTVVNETLEIKDNFIVVNSDGDPSANILSGVAIRTDANNNAYGIAYDQKQNSVSLGAGTIDSNNNFQFNSEESNPILTRDVSENLTHGHLLAWDSERKIAVDGGTNVFESLEGDLKKTFATWDAYNSLAADVGNLETNADNLNEETSNLNTNKQDKTDYSLNTESKEVVGAINEIDFEFDDFKDELENTTFPTFTQSIKNVNDQLASHKDNKENPHEVKWSQIRKDPDVFSDVAPYKDGFDPDTGNHTGAGSPGTSTRVSRSDHIHPTDTSRAPKEHTDTAGEYGKATDSMYGHVKVDSSINADSVNPVQNKIVKEYVDTAISNLDVDKVSLGPSETISSINEKDGKISVTTQSIQIAQSQVNGLNESFNQANESIQGVIDTYNTAIDGLSKEVNAQKEALQQEQVDRANGYENLGTQINTTNGNLGTLKTKVEDLEDLTSRVSDAVNSLDEKIDNIDLFDDKILLTGPYTFTTSFGYYTTSNNAPKEYGSKNQSLRSFLQGAFAKEDNQIAITNTSAAISLSKTEEIFEVGTSYTLPTASVSTNSGKYGEYGGKNAAGTKIANNKNLDDVSFNLTLTYTAPGKSAVTIATATGMKEDNTATDDKVTFIGTTFVPAEHRPTTMVATDNNIVHKFNGTFKNTASGYKPITNLGNFVSAINNTNATTSANYDDGAPGVDARITATDMAEKTYTVKGYRKWYKGGDTKTDFEPATIKALTGSTAAVTKHTFELKAADYAGCSRVVVAIPEASNIKVTQVLLKSSSNADITGEFKQINHAENVILVGGANDYDPKAYNVWEYKPASLDSTEVYTITLG